MVVKQRHKTRRRPGKIVLAVVATANLSVAQSHQQQRLRVLQSENINKDTNSSVTDDDLLGLEVIPDMMETQQQDSNLSYNLDGGVDLSATFPTPPQSSEEQYNMVLESQNHTQVHMSASSDIEDEASSEVETDLEVMVPDNETDASIRETLNEAEEGSPPHDAYYIMTRKGKSSKSVSAKSNKSDKHSGKPSEGADWWPKSHSPTSKHTPETAPPNNWHWTPGGKATKLFKSKSSGWWPPHPNPSKMPTTTRPTMPSSPPSIFPPLVWEGVNGCTPESPCGVCTGDCDSNEDCIPGFQCFKRSGSEPVPGCTPGGIGDIPGADYCYDPNAPPPTSPTVSPTPSPSGGSLPFLQWKGVNGCTPSSPCDVCQGDCDENADCSGGFECFKRADGEYTQVPGCAVGGSGDIAGADYCYDPSSVRPPSVSPTPIGKFPTIPPQTIPPGTETPTRSLEAFFLQSQAKSFTLPIMSLTRERASNGSRNLQQLSAQNSWCAGGALAPDYYQLLLEECKPNPSATSSSIPIGKVEQMDQLWNMDSDGYIRSIFNPDRCMMVSSSSVQFESPIEIGPCNLDGMLNQFYYQTSSFPYTLKLKGEAYASLCVTFLGDEPSRGAEMVLGPCENEAKFGWDFIPEASLGKPTMAPTVSGLPKLRYLGRDACTVDSPCDACVGDCDTNEDCNSGLQCFQRERGDSTQVPGCAIGGVGDIPGADYCSKSNGPTPSISPTPSSQLPPLEWRGSRGCSADMPCPICTGDCNSDDDCNESLSCFKRDAGDDIAVPGCAVGGIGDIPGGDYCYDPNPRTISASSPNNESRPGLVPPNTQGGNNSQPGSYASVQGSNSSANSDSVPRPPTSSIINDNSQFQSNNFPSNPTAPTVLTVNNTPSNPTKTDVSIHDDTATTAPTPGSKSSKSSSTKVSTNK